jgi:outer membrane immunogenic protein
MDSFVGERRAARSAVERHIDSSLPTESRHIRAPAHEKFKFGETATLRCCNTPPNKIFRAPDSALRRLSAGRIRVGFLGVNFLKGDSLMLRKILLASAGTIALASQAIAADLPSRAPPPVYIPPTPIFTWTGVYIGGQVGYAWGTQRANVAFPTGILFNSYSAEGVIGGAHVGYNYQVNQWVLGIEGSVDGTSISKTYIPGGTIFPAFPGFGATYSTSSPIQGSIRGRVGIAWDRALLYATGGAAFAGVDATYTTPSGSISRSTTRVGWTVGGGIEYAVTNNWSVYAEYRYSDFGNYANDLANVFTPGGVVVPIAATVNRHFTQNQVQVGFSYRFAPPPAPIVSKY